MSPEDELGPLTRTYLTDNQERRKRALILLISGAASTPAPVIWAIVEQQRRHPADTGLGGLEAPGFIAAMTIMVMGLGVVLFMWFWFSRDEKFHLYEQGLVRETSEGLDVVVWRDIYKVAPPLGSLTQWGLGGETGFRLKLTSGQTMYITGFTEDAPGLRSNIEDRMPRFD